MISSIPAAARGAAQEGQEALWTDKSEKQRMTDLQTRLAHLHHHLAAAPTAAPSAALPPRDPLYVSRGGVAMVHHTQVSPLLAAPYHPADPGISWTPTQLLRRSRPADCGARGRERLPACEDVGERERARLGDVARGPRRLSGAGQGDGVRAFPHEQGPHAAVHLHLRGDQVHCASALCTARVPRGGADWPGAKW